MDLNDINHPCFNVKARHKFGRVHLPVAPRCNVQCKYCDRKYDCVNESRPGVTSAVLTPKQAMVYLDYVFEKLDNVSVVGIAGPGDPFANPEETMETLRRVREKYPDILLCLATNGLGIGPYIDDLADLNVGHVTITLNAVDPEIGAQIYAYVRYEKKVLSPQKGFGLLLEKQLSAIQQLKTKGIMIKVNTVILPGINDDHLEAVAKKIAELGVDIMNCIPFYPNSGAAFGHLEAPSKETIKRIRTIAGQHVFQMYHCARCRSDAVGILGERENADIVKKLRECAELPETPDDSRPYVAVASTEGRIVNQKLGEASELLIYRQEKGLVKFVESRKTPERGGGIQRWEQLAEMIHDCQALVVSGMGNNPRQILTQKAVTILEVDGLVEDAVTAVFEGYGASDMIKQEIKACNSRCPGPAMGAMSFDGCI